MRKQPVRFAAGYGVRLACLLAVALLSLAAQEQQPPAVYQGIQEDLPKTVEPQPVPFNHRLHVDAGTECLDCHAGAAKKEVAGIPNIDDCMLCHAAIKTESPEIQRLAKMQAAGERLKWVRVYEVPDVVFFSHVNHVKAGEECATCHGPVGLREVLAKEISTSMTTCMNCHAERNFSNECFLCHQLGH